MPHAANAACCAWTIDSLVHSVASTVVRREPHAGITSNCVVYVGLRFRLPCSVFVAWTKSNSKYKDLSCL